MPESVQCANCGRLGLRNLALQTLCEAPPAFRDQGTAPAGCGSVPQCQAGIQSFDSLSGSSLVTELHKPRVCSAHFRWVQGFTPQEHLEIMLKERSLELAREQIEEDRRWRDERTLEDRLWRKRELWRQWIVAAALIFLAPILSGIVIVGGLVLFFFSQMQVQSQPAVQTANALPSSVPNPSTPTTPPPAYGIAPVTTFPSGTGYVQTQPPAAPPENAPATIYYSAAPTAPGSPAPATSAAPMVTTLPTIPAAPLQSTAPSVPISKLEPAPAASSIAPIAEAAAPEGQPKP